MDSQYFKDNIQAAAGMCQVSEGLFLRMYVTNTFFLS